MQDIREINNIIKEKIKSPELSDIYAAIAHNSHLPFATAVKLGAAFGAVAECNTYDGWNSRGIRVRKGQHSEYEIPERCADGIKAKNYFSVQQTTAAGRNKRTLQSLFKNLNDYSFMKINAANVDFEAICAAVRNYADDNGIEFNADYEQIIVSGIASILAHSCRDSSSIEITPQPFPDRDYLENANLLKEVGEYAHDLLELIELAENKAEEQHSGKSNVRTAESTAQTETGKQIELFDIQPDTAKQQTPQTEPVAESSAVQLLPMYQAYLDKKAAYPGALVFQRVGDFYEVLGEEDTKNLSEILNLTIVGRMVGLPERMPMVGVPQYAIDNYITRLLDDGTYKKIIIADEKPEVPDRICEYTPKQAAAVEEAKAKLEERKTLYETNRAQARSEAERTGEPYVTIQFSENSGVKPGVFSLYEADKLLAEIDKQRTGIGYDKVDFHIDFINSDGQLDSYENGRYDIGDHVDGLINHIEKFISYYKTHKIYDTFSEKDVDNILEFCAYLRQHKKLSEIYEKFEGSVDEMHVVYDYIKTTRAALNATEHAAEFVLPEPPEVLKSNKAFNQIVNGETEEDTSVQEIQANTVVTAPIEQEQQIEEEDDIAAEEERLTFGGAKTRFKDNLEALKVYRRLTDTGAAATPAEKAILKKYIGWGGLSEVFDTNNASWAEERRELTKYLSPYEYDEAKSTVTDAFYTPFTVVKGIYAALERFGVKGENRILEPSMGVGNFFRVMPDKIKENSELHGVEIDHVTGEIAKLIYPEADITVKGFEKTLLPSNNFDIVVGNVPFGSSKPVDIEKDYNFELHNFVIAKSVDKTRAGGIIALITTSSTMNEYYSEARQYIADRAKFLGAIRLPYDTFKANANTSVTTDIIFLQKREEIINSNDTWLNSEWRAVNDNLDNDYLNDYFAEHPEMVLGEYKRISGRFGYHCVPMLKEGETLQEKLSEAISYLPSNIFTPIEHKKDEPAIDQLPADDSVRNFCYTIVDGKLYQRQGEILVNLPVKATPKNALERISTMIELRNEVRNILNIQLNNCSDEELKAAQGVLNTHYDEFVKKYGYLHSSANKALFQNDADFQLLLSLELENSETKEISKADIFTKRSISPDIKPQHTDSALDALQVCKSERGGVDIKFIEDLTGKDFETVVSELKGFIFKNPTLASNYDKYRGYEAAEKYLAGDVKTKLQEAERAADINEEFIDNVRALKDVQPAPIPAEDIIVSLGATWIDNEIYEQFFCEDILKIHYNKYGYGEKITVSYNELVNGYIVDEDLYGAARSEANTNTYGTNYISAVELFEQALNLKSPNIYDADTDADGKPIRVFNPKKTALAREKQTKIKTEFAQWIFSDEKRREYLTKKYNDLFNRLKLAEYDGSSLTFPEMNPLITLNAHQRNAVYRGMADGTVLLHHCVGAGKTYEMDALIMKLRQSGLAKKPLQVVPKATLEQAEIEFRTLYPNANLLVARNEDFSKERLKAFTAKIALGDWDCIIMSSSQFNRIKVSPEREAKKLSEEIDKITETLKRAQSSRGRKDNGLSVKRLSSILKNKRADLERLMSEAQSDKSTDKRDFIRFEDLGVDYLFVDEAHFYKNKYFFTKMSNVAGINSTSSKRATSLDLKIDYINELHGGDKGVVFATGTPISNSMSEMYTMQSYLQKSQLRKMGLDTFDAWASTFGEIVKSYELKPSGNGYRTRERFASFVNVPELMNMYGMFADIKMLEELKLPVPNVKYEKVIAPKTAQVVDLMLDISERAERINRGGVDPSEDNMLKITTDGKKIALDPRLFNPELSEPEGGKLQLCAEKVAEIYHDTADKKSTQMIFCDSSTPKSGMSYEKYNSKENFNVYFEMKKKLIELGVAENEIAFIHDYEEDAKIKLKEAMAAGKIRVLLGSTSKCGTGLNVQQKLIAGHHLDIPYRPSDMEQREGRIIRQGNENSDVTIYTYAQEGTFDVYLFQILETKQKFIKQLLDFKVGSRKIEDIADNSVLSYGEMKAAISGNPAIIELEQLKQKIDNLNLLHAEYQRNLFRLQTRISTDYPREIERTTRNIANLEKDCAMISENKTEEFEITINGQRFEGRTDEAGEVFMSAYNAATEGGEPFARFCGFDISKDTRTSLTETPKLILKGAGKYTLSIGDSGVGALTRLNNLINDFPDRLEREKMALRQAENDLEEAKEEATKPFARAEELTTVTARIEELRSSLEISDVATDDVVIDSSIKPDEKDSTETDEYNYRRLPLEFLDKDDLFREIAQRFSVEVIDGVLKERERGPKLSDIKTSGIDYENISSYSYEDLKAAREKIHSYITKRGFVIEDLIPAEYGTTNAIVHRVMKDAEGNTTLDDYLIALNYNVNTGDWAQGKYDFNSLKSVTDFYNREYGFETYEEARKYYKDTYDVDLGESLLPELSEEYRRTATEQAIRRELSEPANLSAEELLQKQLYGVIYNWKGLKEENSVYTAEQLQAADEDFNPELDVQDGGFAANKTYMIYKLNGATVEETAAKVKAFMSGSLNDTFSDDNAEMPLGWYWETNRENLFTGELNPTTEALIKHFNLSEQDLKMQLTQDNLPQRLKAYLNEGLRQIQWLNGKLTNFTEDEIEDLSNDLKTWFENSEFDESKGKDFDGWYDNFVEETLLPELNSRLAEGIIQEQINDGKQVNEIDYMQEVTESVSKEYTEFYNSLSDSQKSNYYAGGEQLEVYQIFTEYLCESELVSDEVFKTLYKEKGHILKNLYEAYDEVDRNDMSTYGELSEFVENYCERSKAEYIKAQPVYLGTWHQAEKNDELDIYRYSHNLSEECKHAIDEAIRNNFDGMHLKNGFADELIQKYGIERIGYILATTIRERETDGRFSRTNKDWARTIPVSESEDERRNCCLNVHPAVLDGFVNTIRQKINEKEKAEFISAWNSTPEVERKAVKEELLHAERMNFINDETHAKQRLEWVREIEAQANKNNEAQNIIEIRGASRTFYKGYVALVHPLNKDVLDSPVEVYLGKKENYDEKGHYDNSDNSLIFVSTNPKMFSFIRDNHWVYSQQQFIEKGIFTEHDYKEFYELKNGLLKNFETNGEILFAVDIEKPGSGTPFNYPNWKENSTTEDKISRAVPKSTTLGEDLVNAPTWNKVVLPNSAIAIKGDKNVKIVMPEGCEHSGAEFWVSKKFIKNATEKNFKLILPDKYTVQLKTPQGGTLSLQAKQVVDELAQHASTFVTRPIVEDKDDIIDLDAGQKKKEVEINPDSISELNLSALRQELVKSLISSMENADVEWIRSWATSLPKNGSTGREYSGINNLLLSLEKHRRGYSDNRWCTFNQIQDHKWKLKKGSKAAQIEVVKFIDKTTKKEFNEQSVEGMTEEERKKYWSENVYPIMRSYSVFNADCIEGIPAEQLNVLNETERNERCEKILANSPAKVFYDGENEAYYRPSTDTIHLPKRERFYSMDDFYYTALHEVGHSTGHPTRLNRNISGMQGSENYAREELCAEIGSLFLGQSLGLKVSDTQLKSSAAYLKGWAQKIRNDPKYLLTAITEANKISKYVLSLQAGAGAANNMAAQEMKLEAMQRNGTKKQTSSAFAGKVIGKPDTAKSKNRETTNIME